MKYVSDISWDNVQWAVSQKLVNWRSRQESLEKQKPGASSALKMEVVRGPSKKHAGKRVLRQIRSRGKRGGLEASQKQVTLAQPLHHFQEASRKSEPHGKNWHIAEMLHSWAPTDFESLPQPRNTRMLTSSYWLRSSEIELRAALLYIESIIMQAILTAVTDQVSIND
jgi:hypothetical protein